MAFEPTKQNKSVVPITISGLVALLPFALGAGWFFRPFWLGYRERHTSNVRYEKTMKRSAVRMLFPAIVSGLLVTTYWLLAFWAALTTPIFKTPGPHSNDPWEVIDPIRDAGLEVALPLLMDESKLFRVPLVNYRMPVESHLAVLSFFYGVLVFLGALAVTASISTAMKRRRAIKQANKAEQDDASQRPC